MTDKHPVPGNNARIGMHYFPDTLHYRESDLLAWLPMLKSLGAQWLTLISPPNRAIPEVFIRGLIENGIEPILHIRQPLSPHPDRTELELLLNSYADWGVRYIALFDRPNTQAAWSGEDWVQQKLVERFLDTFIEYAEIVCRLGMYPIFSPLEPGGNFWDTAFLRSALQEIKSRGHERLLTRLVIGAYAWPDNQSLNWGSGGPERLPGTRPYFTPEKEQNQLGFRIFDWYNTISEAVLNIRLPIILMGTGCRIGDQKDLDRPIIDMQQHAEQNLQIAQLLAGEELEDTEENEKPEEIPNNVLVGNFWLLSSEANDPQADQTWFNANGQTLPVVSLMQNWWAKNNTGKQKTSNFVQQINNNPVSNGRTIQHYLLLPVYEWGISDWHLEVTQPFIRKYMPTVGFSVEEACQAENVTVVGGEKSFSPKIIKQLTDAGCHVRQVSGDGTNIATQLESM
jgi:hypothetical protein